MLAASPGHISPGLLLSGTSTEGYYLPEEGAEIDTTVQWKIGIPNRGKRRNRGGGSICQKVS